jgi:hypothetical protein
VVDAENNEPARASAALAHELKFVVENCPEVFCPGCRVTCAIRIAGCAAASGVGLPDTGARLPSAATSSDCDGRQRRQAAICAVGTTTPAGYSSVVCADAATRFPRRASVLSRGRLASARNELPDG